MNDAHIISNGDSSSSVCHNVTAMPVYWLTRAIINFHEFKTLLQEQILFLIIRTVLFLGPVTVIKM